jgi:hypothetical protein
MSTLRPVKEIVRDIMQPHGEVLIRCRTSFVRCDDAGRQEAFQTKHAYAVTRSHANELERAGYAQILTDEADQLFARAEIRARAAA